MKPKLPIPKSISTLLAHEEISAFLATRPNHGIPLQRFFAAAGVTSWEKVVGLRRRDGVLAIEKLRRAGCMPSTVGHAVGAARALYRYLADVETVEVNPLADVKVDSKSQVPMWNVLSPEQTDKILGAIDGKNAARDRAVVAAILDHGFRASELCGIKWGDIRTETGERRLLTIKGKLGKEYRLYLKPRTVDLAFEWLREIGLITEHHGRMVNQIRPESAFVPGRDLRPLDRFQVYEIVKRWTAAVGAKASPHGLRATFVSLIIKDTHDIEKARQLARHDSISTTQRYHRYTILE